MLFLEFQVETIAFISGIYQELIDSINKIDLKTILSVRKNGIKATWAALNGNFLLALISGIFISILTFSKVITFLLDNHPILVWSFFFGLVLASILLIWKQITHWKYYSLFALLLGTFVSYYITIAKPVASPDSLPYLFLSGFVAIIAMILPGVSGAFILLLMGSYQTVIGTINQFREGIASFNMEIFRSSHD
jgi:putative membrane protein